jgi:hypothetical protein
MTTETCIDIETELQSQRAARKLKIQRIEDNVVAFGLGTSFVSGAALTSIYVFTAEPAQAAPSPEVQAVVTNALDTIPLLTGVCMAVFGAGLAPWAARTTLSWLSSIMKGAI